jgi:hypothetical protein
MASSERFVAVGEEEIFYIISNIFAKPQVFYYLVSDAKIFDIIYQLSPLLECDPNCRVTLRQTVRSHSNKGDNCIRSPMSEGGEQIRTTITSRQTSYRTRLIKIDIPTNQHTVCPQ